MDFGEGLVTGRDSSVHMERHIDAHARGEADDDAERERGGAGFIRRVSRRCRGAVGSDAVSESTGE